MYIYIYIYVFILKVHQPFDLSFIFKINLFSIIFSTRTHVRTYLYKKGQGPIMTSTLHTHPCIHV
jgi:hypothetical protein